MELRDYLIQGSLLRFEKVLPMQKILLIRDARDGHKRSYVGIVKQLRKPNAFVIDMSVEEFFEDGVKSPKFKTKDISFRNSSEIQIYLLESVSFDAKAKLAEERKAYAKARKALQQARTVEETSFSILGISENISEKDFSILKKKVMLKWHPDRIHASSLSKEEFEKESKKYTDALSWVSNYLSNKSKRLQ